VARVRAASDHAAGVGFRIGAGLGGRLGDGRAPSELGRPPGERLANLQDRLLGIHGARALPCRVHSGVAGGPLVGSRCARTCREPVPPPPTPPHPTPHTHTQAPEVMLGREYGEKADVFSWAMVTYNLFMRCD
jgi:hypothetical protein